MTRRNRRRDARRAREPGRLPQPPWRPLRYRHPPFELLSPEQIEEIHDAGIRILRDIGMVVLSASAREIFARAGCDVDAESQRVRFEPALLESLVASAPSEFTLRARNPDKTLRLGNGHACFTSVGGPAYVMDLDHGRRNGSYAEQCDFIRLVQSLDILHQEGGGGFEAMDLPAPSRHLDLFYAECTLLDKNWVPWTMGRAQALDAIEMAAISLGLTIDQMIETPALCGIINTNTPLQLDIPMAEGLIAMAEHGQAVAVTPFTLAGAMAPVTLAGSLALQHAEAMTGIALTQIVRPGAPVLYGAFTSNVDMKTGSPAFGTPEYLQAAQASGQLARRLGLPLRSSNVTAANAPDAQAAYESCLSLWGAVSAQASMVKHAAGWLHGGLTASLEKLIIDAEVLQMVAASLEPFAVDADALALDAIADVGPGGHFFGSPHTLSRYEDAFYTPLLSDWNNYETWLEAGAMTSDVRANNIWKRLLVDYEQPTIDPSIDEALRDYVARRKHELATR